MTDLNALRKRIRGDLRAALWLDWRPEPGTRATPEFYEELLSLAEMADDLGYTAVITPEHHTTDDDYLPTPHQALAAVGARTKNVMLSGGMALAPLWPTRILAEELSVLDLLSGGRAMAGLALGYADFDFEAMNVDRRKRGKLLEEKLDELEGAWGEKDSLSDGFPVTPRPAQPGGPPIMLGGASDPAVERAARRADAFLAFDFRGLAGDYEWLLNEPKRLADACEEAGTEFPVYLLGTLMFVIDDDRDWERYAAPAIAYQHSRYSQWLVDKAERPTEMFDPASLDRDNYFVGTADELVDKVRALYSAIPVDALSIWGRLPYLPHEFAMNNVRRLATEVFPKVADAVPPADWRAALVETAGP